MTSSERRNRIIDTIALLSVSGIGRGRFERLVRSVGSAAAVREAPLSSLAAVTGISRTHASAIKEQLDLESAQKIVEQIEKLQWTVLFPDDPEYPRALDDADQRPPILFRLGAAATGEDRMIAVVGTRHPTEAGKRFAYGLARSLAEAGVVVVSGMAEGIDAAAHCGALDGGGRTVAVWGSSLDQVYPPSNRRLAERIESEGTVYSEYLPGTPPERPHFPERNRIIAGLSAGTVVIEAGIRSGALITASLAYRMGRAVFAVPGAPGASSSLGCNQLIKDGATLVTSAEDIFAEIPALKGEVRTRRAAELPDLTQEERAIVEQFVSGPVQIDQLSRTAQLPISELSQFLLALELKGVVQELSGKRYILAEEYS